MIYRKAQLEDVNTIVRIHCDAFEGFFLTSLGVPFLTFYYTCFVNSYETVTIVSEEKAQICGFAAATTSSKGFNIRFIKNNFLNFVLLSFKMLFTAPKALLRLVKNLTKKGTIVVDDEDYAELYSIGVSPSFQGKGIGKTLLTELEKELKKKGVEKVSLTTDYENNDTAVGFYRSLGYETLYEFITYPDRKMFRLIKFL